MYNVRPLYILSSLPAVQLPVTLLRKVESDCTG